MTQPRTVGELRHRGYASKSVKQEMRDNLVARLRRGESFLPGIVGYDETVIPQIENAVLSGQDVVLLGERGQAKTRIARLLTGLLDETVPVLAGCEINDDPLAPICAACRQRVAERGDAVEVAWLPRDRRYGEKLATPDITIADLIGEVDPIKEAERTAFAADGVRTTTPEYMKQIVAELTHLARKATEISQRSGVSVRVSICNYENLVSSALKRAIRLGEKDAAPRVSDLGALVASTAGKIELEPLGDTSEDKGLGKLLQRAVLNVFNRSLTPAEVDPVVTAFQGGLSGQGAEPMPSAEYVRQAEKTPALRAST